MNKYGVENTYEALRQKMLQYIKTIYMGKNTTLRDACSDELEEPLCINQEPYIEANHAYKTIKNGLLEIAPNLLSKDLKDLYEKMIADGLGVFRNPYVHQVKAMEAFLAGKDLLVATGTGSGKTECFMWPIVGKLFNEADIDPSSWSQRGVRALMLYPMNALVSDQLGRLRKMIGDTKGNYASYFTSIHCRRPQFGMYTGRTPYSGERSDDEDKKLAKTLEENLVNCPEKAKERLRTIGKYPAKVDLPLFVSKLKKGQHYTDANDAELLTRKEIQDCCPDILITNYSMLEYMLIRPIEAKIWDDTKRWLNSNPSNKLLFVIDEAHMYRGSSGGEVALLIRRLMHRLEINRSQIQFILTTASIPTGDDSAVVSFANALSAQADDATSFEIIRGTAESVDYTGSREYKASSLFDIDVDDLVGTPERRTAALKEYADIFHEAYDGIDFTNDGQVENWLYSILLKDRPLLRIIDACRGNATRLDDLASIAFPNEEINDAIKGTTVLLALAPIAKNKDGNVLFPARLHLMFRGLRGLYACINPSCSCKQDAKGKELPTGRIFFSQENDICECGGKVFELLNDRTCGALFFKGFLDRKVTGPKYIWPRKGMDFSEDLCEVHFYIIQSGETLNKRDITNGDTLRFGWIDSISGRLYEDDSQANNLRCIHVAYCQKADKDLWSFDSCPHCGRKHLTVTNFSTKGNEPFFNLVSEQLANQPQTLFNEEDLANSPNKGRKVLLFSDSRQKAAILAKDLTRAADEDAMKKALTIAAKTLQEWASNNNCDPSMDLLYAVIVEIAAKNGLRFFYGDDEGLLQAHIERYKEEIEMCEWTGEEFSYKDFAQKVKPVPGLYSVQLLKQICSNYRSLSDVAFCWVAPCKKQLQQAMFLLNKGQVTLSSEEYLSVFSAWAIDSLTSNYAYGINEISDKNREDAAMRDGRWGLKQDHEIDTDLKRFLSSNRQLSDTQIETIRKCLLLCAAEDENGNKYINPALVTLRYEPYPEKEWYVCPRCGRVAPHSLWGRCPHCFKADVIPMDERSVEGLKFWRDPVLRVMAGDENTVMTSINAEEHTAQLSHKDQVDSKMWSTTEDFEMRFQNVFVDEKNAKPVDVLSCTTTMEVGIDIGSLTAVGLRNIPPMRENYQQRAGRAGRRGAAVSTIVTYIDDGPHDSYYFEHPEAIISGEPRTPWIDSHNKKLVFRHLNIVTMNDFLHENGLSMDSVDVESFCLNYIDELIDYVQNKEFDKDETYSLVPTGMEYCVDSFKEAFVASLRHIQETVRDFPELYKNDKGIMSSLLDVMYREGIMPTYSFPKDVVGFFIEDPDGKRIVEKPERSLDMAITEYAPGRTLVVNKKTYKAGGLYNFHAKRASGRYDNPARKYLTSSEFVKQLYLCKNPACQWFSTEAPANGRCPFCGGSSIATKQMIKPWGFAPLNGRSIRESEAENEPSYAENPSYAATPDDQMQKVADFSHVKVAKRADQQLLIINKGVDDAGFIVCRNCGAAVSSDDLNALHDNNIQKPYINPANPRKCNHDGMSAFIGTDVRTDMVVYEFSLDNEKIDTGFQSIWLKQAAITLAEAMVLCAGRLLDVEFNEIKSGYRIRFDDTVTYLDVFLFDSLSSGAGYCAMVADLSSELLKSTLEYLSACSCDTSCHKCLNHFWNQRNQGKMNRHAAIDVLNWCLNDRLPMPIDNEKYKHLAMSIEEMFNADTTQPIRVTERNGVFYISKLNVEKRLYIYPAMWNPHSTLIPNGSIAVSDAQIKTALPSVYAKIVSEIDKPITKPTTPGNNTLCSISIRGGVNLADEDYSAIWDYVIDDDDVDSIQEGIIRAIKDQMTTAVYEKPIYSANVHVSDGVNQGSFRSLLAWKNHKTILFALHDDTLDSMIQNGCEWNCIYVDQISDVNRFLRLIEV